ncbi:MAG TPA: ABC transporter ATP-binding protein [Bryobacteraceae bacterium]|nr:ABC transporter ATP-binding protein [Bryobacteraceae bacterium]
MPDALLTIRSVEKSFGAMRVLRGVTLEVAAGEFLTILGESGSGKTTLLRMIAGFEQPDAGEIAIDGERIDPLPPNRRPVNTVFQHYALFPHLSVFENVAYGLRVKKVPKTEVDQRVEEALALVQMSKFARQSPAKISGGQQQRVALARALVNRPKLLLLDEPLSALDAALRRQMQTELKSLQRQVGITFIFVTHDQDEAMVMSDRIALLRSGVLEQIAAPREIYRSPRTTYTAQFIGQTNLLRGTVAKGAVSCGCFRWVSQEADGPVIFSLRPEDIHVADQTKMAAPGSVRFHGRIERTMFHGSSELLEAVDADGRMLLVECAGSRDLRGEVLFEFAIADAVRVAETTSEG